MLIASFILGAIVFGCGALFGASVMHSSFSKVLDHDQKDI